MSQTNAPSLSVIVVFFNMRREAKRTLSSITPSYQRDVSTRDYEVIAVDNGSSEPLDESWVLRLADNFSYVYHDTASKSPCGALNRAVELAKSDFVMCLIDGARILSPGILKYSLLASKLYDHPFIYTLGMHIGKKPQNYLLAQGYDQQVEDELFATVDWQSNGYRLFAVSSLALSCIDGFFSQLTESNCFCLRKSDYWDLGGFDERFVQPGGGLANLDFFNKAHEHDKLVPLMLLGEATFHQFHGGVATNVPMTEHPWEKMAKEYQDIEGKPFASSYRAPHYYGSVPAECRPFLNIDAHTDNSLPQAPTERDDKKGRGLAKAYNKLIAVSTHWTKRLVGQRPRIP